MLFFFQAEDGIRDIGVTGVQTCALPIWRLPWRYRSALSRRLLTMPRSMEATCSSGTLSTPEGRAAISTSLSLAMIMRMGEVRAASPAFMAAFIPSVNRLRRYLRGKSFGDLGA